MHIVRQEGLYWLLSSSSTNSHECLSSIQVLPFCMYVREVFRDVRNRRTDAFGGLSDALRWSQQRMRAVVETAQHPVVRRRLHILRPGIIRFRRSGFNFRLIRMNRRKIERATLFCLLCTAEHLPASRLHYVPGVLVMARMRAVMVLYRIFIYAALNQCLFKTLYNYDRSSWSQS